MRPLLLSGKTPKCVDLTEEWMVKKWPELLEAHFVLPTPGRAVAIADAAHMVEHKIAKISVGKGSVPYEPRVMSDREVAAVQEWLTSKDCDSEGSCIEKQMHALERSLGAQAAHNDEVAGARLDALRDDMKDDFRGVLETVLKPCYPEEGSSAEKHVWIQNERERLNQQARQLRVNDNLVKSAKSARARSTDEETPTMLEIRSKLSKYMSAYDGGFDAEDREGLHCGGAS